MIKLTGINKSYYVGEMVLPVLQNISLHVTAGEFIAIMGSSGSGKTTLLNVIGCLDSVDVGTYTLAGETVQQASDDDLALIRNRHIGFVFQLFNLIPRISALRNVELPMIYTGTPPAERRKRALQALERMAIADRADHAPNQLSGGQQQRVAIARALVNNPKLLVADEPTGSLDSATSREIMTLFRELNQAGTTIVMVTHEENIAAYAGRIIHLKDGIIVADNCMDAEDITPWMGEAEPSRGKRLTNPGTSVPPEDMGEVDNVGNTLLKATMRCNRLC